MAGREEAVLDLRPDLRRELQEADRVRDRRPVLSDPLGDLVLRHPELVLQVPVRLRLLHRRQVPPLDVLDERDEEVVAILEPLPDEDRDAGEAGEARRPDAALARQDPEPVAVAGDEDRLEDPRLLDRPRQLLDPVVVEPAARLLAVRLEVVEVDHLDGGPGRVPPAVAAGQRG